MKTSMNTNSITIDIPEVALFDAQELKLKVSNYIKTLAAKVQKNKTQSKEDAVANWKDIKISPEVMAMTFDERVDLGTTDYYKRF